MDIVNILKKSSKLFSDKAADERRRKSLAHELSIRNAEIAHEMLVEYERNYQPAPGYHRWLSIASAPMDGTTILCYDPTDKGDPIHTIRWDDYLDADGNDTSGWVSSENIGGYHPTDWMPLPPIPE